MRIIIRFIYYIYNYRLLYYLPMERMGTQEKLDRLEINYDYLKEENEKLEKENKKLKEKVETLELWLDNKEKLNEEYRKQIDKLRTDNIYEE